MFALGLNRNVPGGETGKGNQAELAMFATAKKENT